MTEERPDYNVTPIRPPEPKAAPAKARKRLPRAQVERRLDALQRKAWRGLAIARLANRVAWEIVSREGTGSHDGEDVRQALDVLEDLFQELGENLESVALLDSTPGEEP